MLRKSIFTLALVGLVAASCGNQTPNSDGDSNLTKLIKLHPNETFNLKDKIFDLYELQIESNDNNIVKVDSENGIIIASNTEGETDINIKIDDKKIATLTVEVNRNRWYSFLFYGLIFIISFFAFWQRKWLKSFFSYVVNLIKQINDKKNRRKKYDELKEEYKRVLDDKSKIERKYEKLDKDNQDLEQQNKELLEKNIELEKKNQDLEQQNKKLLEENTDEKGKSVTIPEKGKNFEIFASTLYADAIIEGVFKHVKTEATEDTVYVITKTSARTATFSIYPNANKRVLKNPDFIDGCDKQKINPEPQTLEVENGEAAHDDFNKWQITKKAKIKFV